MNNNYGLTTDVIEFSDVPLFEGQNFYHKYPHEVN